MGTRRRHNGGLGARLGGVLVAAAALAPGEGARAAEWRVVDAKVHHLRSGPAGGGREWEEFDPAAEGAELVVKFEGKRNAGEQTLRMRQRDVKQVWRVKLNGTALGTLVQDENEMVAVWAVGKGTLRDGENELRVTCEAGAGTAADDVLVGKVELAAAARAEVLGEAAVTVKVVDAETGEGLPCRVTIVDEGGGLVMLGSAQELGAVVAAPGAGKTQSSIQPAVRTGVVYVRSGWIKVGLNAGRYQVYGGRGFEYEVASEKVTVGAGESKEISLKVRQVVPTDGWVSCDPHVHTLAYSRHGDATLEERMLTLAGEGIEVPVATEHNLQVDYTAAAEGAGVRRYFTPARGNEVTTASLGHFNVFPIPPGAKLINWNRRDWDALARSIAEVAPNAVVVLNHARDVHGGFAPFGPRRHISIAGESVDGRTPPANAMEVINSGATRADPLELFHDWFGLLNRGVRVAPIGASDSHDVARYIVGQARTYVSLNPDHDPSALHVNRVADGIRAGRVAVSYGLLTHLTVADHFGPGELVAPPPDGPLTVDVRVLGPSWVTASRVALYANGVEVEHADIPQPEPSSPQPAPLKWRGRWTLPRPKHDVFLVAIATGPGVTAPYWPAAKPYQPTSPRWTPYVLGATGAAFVDADGNGKFDSARDYATRLVEDSFAGPGDDADAAVGRIAGALAGYDAAVAAQVASLLRARDPARFETNCRRIIESTKPETARGVSAYLEQWKQTAN